MDQQPFQHFVTRFKLSGDVEAAKVLIKTGEREMGKLRNQLGFQDLMQGYRENEPFVGARINCSIVGSVRLIEIYVAPKYPVEPEEHEERPCFCNCCLAECQIVKVDGTWRDNAHYDIPLPDLGYKHGDRRLRYDIDICSFLGISPESGLLTYEFYRVENVMPSDFTPYEVGDWAMVYFTDLDRTTECAKCADCDPPLNDELGRVWGCIPRDVAATLNAPQCIILPIAINDRISRSTVYFRPLESMRLGTCIKKAVIDWVQYSKLDDDGNPVDGYANIRWDAWPSTPGGTVVDNIPIRYCTQDFTNHDGSHAFRWGNSVYLFIEGDQWTVLGHVVTTLPTYQRQQPYQTTPMILSAVLLVKLWTTQVTYDFQNWEGGGPYDTQASIGMLWDFTHDCRFDFTRYSWAEDDLLQPANPDDIDRYLMVYQQRPSGEPSTILSRYEWPSSAFRILRANDAFSSIAGGYCSTHTHAVEGVLTGGTPPVLLTFGAGRNDTYDAYGGLTSSQPTWERERTANFGGSGTVDLTGGETSWSTGEFVVFLGGGDVFNPLGNRYGWSRLQHQNGYLTGSGHVATEAHFNCEYRVELGMSTPLEGVTINLVGFQPIYDRKWKGFVSKSSIDMDYIRTVFSAVSTVSSTFTWEHLDLFHDRTRDDQFMFSGTLTYSLNTATAVSGSCRNAEGITGILLANTSSLTIKAVEARYDVTDSIMDNVSPVDMEDFPIHIELTMPGTSINGRVESARVGETHRYFRLEIGESYSRYDDPFPVEASATSYALHNKPFIESDIALAVSMVPIRMQSVRDDRLANGHWQAIYMTHLETFHFEDRVHIKIY